MAECVFDVKHGIGRLKAVALPLVAPWAKRGGSLVLMLDGEELSDDVNLARYGVDDGQTVDLTCIIVASNECLAYADQQDQYREAVERSRMEAAEYRKAREEKRLRHKQQLQQEHLAEPAQMLMLADGPSICTQGKADNSNAASTTVQAADAHAEMLMLADGPSISAQGKAENSSAMSTIVQVDALAAPKPVGRSWQKEARLVVAAYNDFFEHISFRKGWKEPPFAREESQDAFSDAARLVARIRVEVLDRRDEGFKIRQVDGSARDWMHGATGDLLRHEKMEFVSGLVHSTLMDANGYVEGLTREEVEKLMHVNFEGLTREELDKLIHRV